MGANATVRALSYFISPVLRGRVLVHPQSSPLFSKWESVANSRLIVAMEALEAFRAFL